mgnify:CR=1 FL=1
MTTDLAKQESPLALLKGALAADSVKEQFQNTMAENSTTSQTTHA